jgi:hypothetical protein
MSEGRRPGKVLPARSKIDLVVTTSNRIRRLLSFHGRKTSWKCHEHRRHWTRLLVVAAPREELEGAEAVLARSPAITSASPAPRFVPA